MPSHNNSSSSPLPTSTTRKADAHSSANHPSNRAALSQSGLTPTKTRTFGLSNASQLESAASGHSHVKIFDDGSLQHQRLAMFEAQHVLDDSNAYARFQDSTNTATANRDEAARIAFHQTRAAEAIHQFDNTFNLNK